MTDRTEHILAALRLALDTAGSPIQPSAKELRVMSASCTGFDRYIKQLYYYVLKISSIGFFTLMSALLSAGFSNSLIMANSG